MPHLLQKRVILCVDDEPPVLAAIERMLRHEPYEVLVAQTPAEALDILKSREIDLVIADQRMADMPGSELLRHVHDLSPATGRIMLTGYPDTPVILERVREGVQRLITKPWRDEDLKETIRTMLEPREGPEPSPQRPARGPAVRRLRGHPNLDEAIFRIDCAGRTSGLVHEELAPMLDDVDVRQRGAVLLLRGVGGLLESPLPFLRSLTDTLLPMDVSTTLVEDSGSAGILLDILESPERLEVFSQDRDQTERRVLLAGSPTESLEVLAEVMEAGGFPADTAPSSGEAIRAIRAASYAALIVDLDVAEPDAREVCHEFRKRNPGSGIVALCACADLWDAPARESLALRTLVEKPFRAIEILRAARGAAARSHGRKKPGGVE